MAINVKNIHPKINVPCSFRRLLFLLSFYSFFFSFPFPHLIYIFCIDFHTLNSTGKRDRSSERSEKNRKSSWFHAGFFVHSILFFLILLFALLCDVACIAPLLRHIYNFRDGILFFKTSCKFENLKSRSQNWLLGGNGLKNHAFLIGRYFDVRNY